ncbi:MAG TPA: hypothetical protein PKX45_09105 [Bacillota bacterium]|nr:hypothetical protein [Bacillota bacterium]
MAKPSAIKKAMNKVVGKNTTPPAVFKIPKKKKSRSIPTPEPVYFPPTLTLTDEDYPGADKWKAGQTVTITIKAKVIERNDVAESDWRPEGVEVRLRIQEISEGGGK